MLQATARKIPGALVGASVGESVGASVGVSVGASVGESVGASVGALVSDHEKKSTRFNSDTLSSIYRGGGRVTKTTA